MLIQNASLLALHLFAQKDFLIDNAHTRRQISTTRAYDGKNGLDVSAWTRRLPEGVIETLIMAVQMNYVVDKVEFGIIGVKGRISKVLFGEVYDGIKFRMGKTSVAAVILRWTQEEEDTCDIRPSHKVPIVLSECASCNRC